MNLPVSTQMWRGVEIGVLNKRWGKLFGSGEKVLDLGCGEGEIAKEVFGEIIIEWGLDCDSEMVEKAKTSGIYKKVLLASAESIPLPDSSVKLVFCNSVLEHIPNVQQVLREVARVLEKGGRFVTTMPSYKLSEYLGWGRVYAYWFNKKYHHYHLYDLRKWETMFEQEGLEVEESYSYLDQEAIKQWHKMLWKQKLGWKVSNIMKQAIAPKTQAEGAAIAILGRKK